MLRVIRYALNYIVIFCNEKFSSIMIRNDKKVYQICGLPLSHFFFSLRLIYTFAPTVICLRILEPLPTSSNQTVNKSSLVCQLTAQNFSSLFPPYLFLLTINHRNRLLTKELTLFRINNIIQMKGTTNKTFGVGVNLSVFMLGRRFEARGISIVYVRMATG